jgi:predicted dithiol-disulfide oxidoreductase (DUF899 family)
MTQHPIATRDEWLAARRDLLAREKHVTRLDDELARRRLELPWVRVEKAYRFETDEGTRTLAELFDGRSQLLVYHFMFGPDATEGCPSCSFSADQFDGVMLHLNQRDVTLIGISRGRLEALQAYKRRMGWRFPWVSSLGSDFNFDYGVSFTEEQQATSATYNFAPIERPNDELPGVSAFALEDGVVYHTYSAFARGGEPIMGVYQWLDRAPRGRDEDGFPWPMAWVRRHDEYDAPAVTGG